MPNSKLINRFLVGTMAIAVAGAATAQNGTKQDNQSTDQTNQQRQGDPTKLKQAAQNVAKDAPGVDASRAEPINGEIFHAQVLLDRAGFSPGWIDGRSGMSYELALKGFQEANGLKVTGALDQQTRQALLRDKMPSTRRLKIDEGDAKGPFVGTIPDDPAEQAKMERLGYRNLLEKIAEKFHTTPATIVALNDPSMVLKAGTVLRLPNVLPSSRSYPNLDQKAAQLASDLNIGPDQPKGARIVGDKSDKLIRVYDDQDKLIAQFPATMGSGKDPLPLGTWKINAEAFLPPFSYQPELFWDVPDSESKQMLPPGPNGPVGVVWLDLSKENYGIHGTNAPTTIQRAESHGCVRLTNWDAVRLALMVEPGTEVVFQA